MIRVLFGAAVATLLACFALLFAEAARAASQTDPEAHVLVTFLASTGRAVNAEPVLGCREQAAAAMRDGAGTIGATCIELPRHCYAVTWIEGSPDKVWLGTGSYSITTKPPFKVTGCTPPDPAPSQAELKRRLAAR